MQSFPEDTRSPKDKYYDVYKGLRKFMKVKYLCNDCGESKPEKFSKRLKHLCKKCFNRVIKDLK